MDLLFTSGINILMLQTIISSSVQFIYSPPSFFYCLFCVPLPLMQQQSEYFSKEESASALSYFKLWQSVSLLGFIYSTQRKECCYLVFKGGFQDFLSLVKKGLGVSETLGEPYVFNKILKALHKKKYFICMLFKNNLQEANQFDSMLAVPGRSSVLQLVILGTTQNCGRKDNSDAVLLTCIITLRAQL